VLEMPIEDLVLENCSGYGCCNKLDVDEVV
jgi:hypothetical protein